ncbi:MAG: uncharacterized protein KVP18_001726 [Porospora cf. gigantea A]|uniref:uncharacterized protein n=1 Tax=Porospora cf. gigantea A TaxID=2853593 RepID=UPI00355988BB|nr:MAG: hypothetical protein KVP18_001726 [Porospora cf. gigantea A]
MVDLGALVGEKEYIGQNVIVWGSEGAPTMLVIAGIHRDDTGAALTAQRFVQFLEEHKDVPDLQHLHATRQVIVYAAEQSGSEKDAPDPAADFPPATGQCVQSVTSRAILRLFLHYDFVTCATLRVGRGAISYAGGAESRNVVMRPISQLMRQAGGHTGHSEYFLEGDVPTKEAKFLYWAYKGGVDPDRFRCENVEPGFSRGRCLSFLLETTAEGELEVPLTLQDISRPPVTWSTGLRSMRALLTLLEFTAPSLHVHEVTRFPGHRIELVVSFVGCKGVDVQWYTSKDCESPSWELALSNDDMACSRLNLFEGIRNEVSLHLPAPTACVMAKYRPDSRWPTPQHSLFAHTRGWNASPPFFVGPDAVTKETSNVWLWSLLGCFGFYFLWRRAKNLNQ